MRRLLFSFLRSPFFAMFILLVGLLIVYGQFLWPPEGKILYGTDLLSIEAFLRSFVIDNLKAGKFPFWNPYNFSGAPVSIVWYPLMNLLFWFLPLNKAYALFHFLHIYLAGIFMYFLLQKKLDSLSATIGAVIFALSGHFFSKIYIGHGDYLAATIYIPLIFLSVINIIHNQSYRFRAVMKDYTVFIVSFILQLLTNADNIPVFTVELVGMYFIYHYLFMYQGVHRIKDFTVKALSLSALVLISFSLISFRLIPFSRAVFGHSYRSATIQGNKTTVNNSTPDSLKLFFNTRRDEKAKIPGNYYVFTNFVGKTPFILILLYLVFQFFQLIKRKKTDSHFFFFLLAGTVFTVFSMGINNPIGSAIYDYFPPYRLVQEISRYLPMVVFSIAALTAIAVSQIKNIPIRLIILILILSEILPYSRNLLNVKGFVDMPDRAQDQQLVGFLKKNIGNDRLYTNYQTWSYILPTYQLDYSMTGKIPTTSGYQAIILRDYVRFIDAIRKSDIPSDMSYQVPQVGPWEKKLDFLNVKYILNEDKYDQIGKDYPGKFRKVMTGEGYNLYEKLTFLPRFFLVSKAYVYLDVDQIDKALREDKTDLSAAIYLLRSEVEDLSDLESDCMEKSNLGEVNQISYDIDKIVLKVRAECNAYLSSSETYYPEWRVRIDGKEERIWKSNLAFRAMRIPKGEHSVEFYYYPQAFYLGLGVSLITFIGLIVVTTVCLFRRK